MIRLKISDEFLSVFLNSDETNPRRHQILFIRRLDARTLFDLARRRFFYSEQSILAADNFLQLGEKFRAGFADARRGRRKCAAAAVFSRLQSFKLYGRGGSARGGERRFRR